MQLLNAAVLRRVALLVALAAWFAGCRGKVDTITLAPCSFALSPSNASHTASGGTGSVMVTTQANCSWTAMSDADWVTVTGGSSERGSGTVIYNVAENTTTSARTASIKVVDADGNRAAVFHQVNQAAPTWLTLQGAYTFKMEVDPDGACGWPVTTFYWPVNIKVTSYEQGTTLGSIVFPTTSASASNTWSISAGPTWTELEPRQESPGPAGGAYDVVVDGGRWEAGGFTRSRGGRGEITSGTASGAKQILTLRNSGKQWECQSDVKWSLLIRFVDRD